jgi:hypothetical protein
MKAAYIQYSTVGTGSTITVTDTGDSIVLIHEAALVATLTVTLPATPVDGQQVQFCSIGGVTALTLSTPVGSVIGAITTMAAGGCATYIYRGPTTKWYKIA